MVLTTINRISPFSPNFTWDDYTNELYHLSDDYGFLTVDQMLEELDRFKMNDFADCIISSLSVEEFVDFLFDSDYHD